MNISIIGAGPAGGFAAKLLAEKGHTVTIYEDHPQVGIPVQCTGLLTKTFLELHPIKKEFLINEIKKVRIISPEKTSVEIPLTEYVICRTKFDQYLANLAINAGAQLFTQHRFAGVRNGNILIKHKGEITEKKTDILIGADGPLSEVAKSAGIYTKRKMLIAHQVTIQGNFEPEIFTTYFGKIAPGFFAWVVPESKTIARVGLQTMHDTANCFKIFAKQIPGKILGNQAGPIPLFTGNEIVQKNNTYLIGDAAALTKSTTGGGIYSGMLSSKILAECIENKKDYSKALAPLRRKLWLHKKISQMLARFTDEDYNKLIQLMAKEKVKEVLSTRTRDNPIKLLTGLLTTEPRFLKFATKLLPI